MGTLDRWSKRVVGWAGCLSLVSIPTPTLAQSTVGPGSGGCQNYNQPVYAATGHYILNARIRLCASGAYDITQGSNAPAPGERLFASACRLNGRQPNAFMRGRLNIPYLVNPARDEDVTTTDLRGRPGDSLKGTARVLPFFPKKVLNLGTYDGHTWFGYTDLSFLPTIASAGRPLSANSVIIALDGCSFGNPEALAALLSQPSPKDYVELLYFQPNDPLRRTYRAFVPMTSESGARREWDYLAENNLRPNREGRIMAILSVLAIAKLITGFLESPMGQRMTEEIEACKRRGGIIC